MELLRLTVERYKSYRKLDPLTILIGTDSSGKTPLTQVILLLASRFTLSADEPKEPLSLHFQRSLTELRSKT